MRNVLILAIAPALIAGAVLTTSSQRSAAQAPPQAPGTAPPTSETPSAKPNDKPNNEPLSKKLDKNEGVLKPPTGVDPEIHKAPPANTGDKMPIIVPPGEPGGDQSVQPK
ncbi:MAG TPA: hypothetical protein VIF13_00975 [Hyphomicrobium sp.]|jgi:hypothetical protein